MFRLFPNESLFVCAGLSCYAWAFSSCSEWGLLFVVMHELLLLQSTGSRHMSFSSCRCGFSCSVACGIFPGQGLNPCRLHWQANSHPLYNQGSPPNEIVLKEVIRISDAVFFSIFLICLTLSCRSGLDGPERHNWHHFVLLSSDLAVSVL